MSTIEDLQKATDAAMRRQTTASAKTECEIRAATWRDAASIVRNTTLTVTLYDGRQLASEPKARAKKD